MLSFVNSFLKCDNNGYFITWMLSCYSSIIGFWQLLKYCWSRYLQRKPIYMRLNDDAIFGRNDLAISYRNMLPFLILSHRVTLSNYMKQWGDRCHLNKPAWLNVIFVCSYIINFWTRCQNNVLENNFWIVDPLYGNYSSMNKI